MSVLIQIGRRRANVDGFLEDFWASKLPENGGLVAWHHGMLQKLAQVFMWQGSLGSCSLGFTMKFDDCCPIFG